MASEQISYDRYTLLHLVAAQLAAGLNPSTAQNAVEKYHEVYLRLKKEGGLTPSDP